MEQQHFGYRYLTKRIYDTLTNIIDLNTQVYVLNCMTVKARNLIFQVSNDSTVAKLAMIAKQRCTCIQGNPGFCEGDIWE